MKTSWRAARLVRTFSMRSVHQKMETSSCGTTLSSRWKSHRSAVSWAKYSKQTRSRSMSTFRWARPRSWTVNQDIQIYSYLADRLVMAAQALLLHAPTWKAQLALPLGPEISPCAMRFSLRKASWMHWTHNKTPTRTSIWSSLSRISVANSRSWWTRLRWTTKIIYEQVILA